MDAKKLHCKGKLGKADVAIAKIQKLYTLESRLKLASSEERWFERQSSAKPMLDGLYEWLTSQDVIESSPLAKDIKYTLGHSPKLISTHFFPRSSHTKTKTPGGIMGRIQKTQGNSRIVQKLH